MQRIFESQRQEGARRLAATIVHCYDKPVQDIELACSDLEDITSALNSFQAHFAAGGRGAGKDDQGVICRSAGRFGAP